MSERERLVEVIARTLWDFSESYADNPLPFERASDPAREEQIAAATAVLDALEPELEHQEERARQIARGLVEFGHEVGLLMAENKRLREALERVMAYRSADCNQDGTIILAYDSQEAARAAFDAMNSDLEREQDDD